MSNNNLYSTIAGLETKVDMLEAELVYINELLLRVGFPEGIESLKLTMEELIAEETQLSSQKNSHPSEI